jgi:hypothetical protein
LLYSLMVSCCEFLCTNFFSPFELFVQSYSSRDVVDLFGIRFHMFRCGSNHLKGLVLLLLDLQRWSPCKLHFPHPFFYFYFWIFWSFLFVWCLNYFETLYFNNNI